MSTSNGTIGAACPIPTSKPPPDGFTDSLPPWTLQAEAWWIFSAPPLPWKTKKLPKGALDPLESSRLQEFEAAYQGGMGIIQLTRFHSSPVGPYEELIYIPGQMKYKVGDLSVSGRRIWNTPKHLARFEFTPETSDPLSPTVISVYPSLSDGPTPEFGPDPMFRARIVPSRYLPRLPWNVSRFPRALFDTQVLQPPLNDPIGTEKWITVDVGNSGHVRIIYPEAGLEGGRYGDGIGCPDFRPMRFGLWCSNLDQIFPPPEILDLGPSEPKKTK